MEGAGTARYLESGHLLSARSGDQLMATPMSPETLELTGPPVPLAREFATRREGAFALFEVTSDGTAIFLPPSEEKGDALQWLGLDGSRTTIADAGEEMNYPSLSPEGSHLACTIWDPGGEKDWNLLIVPTDGSGPPFVFHREPSNEQWPRFSPDGRWLAFTSDRTGTSQVYIQRFPEEGGLFQVSDAGGAYPLWTPDGDALLYLGGDLESLTRARIEPGDPPRISKPGVVRKLPEDLPRQDGRLFGGVDRGGSRLLLIRRATRTDEHLDVIENWFPGLREMAPYGR